MQRSPLSLFVRTFFGSAILVIAAIGVGWMLGHPDHASGTAKTKLEERIETARQIRRALATPIPPPEPLQPISTKADRSQNTTPGEDDQPQTPRLSRSERDAMAREQRRSSYPHRYPERTGTGGW